jgi:hypothetical protein
MAGSFSAEPNERGGSPRGQGMSFAPNARGGHGAETTGVTDSNLSGNVHSSRGFRKALRSSQNKSSGLAGQLPQKQSFSGPGYAKPSSFAQGGKRHGMHIGSGAPFTGGADMEGTGE